METYSPLFGGGIFSNLGVKNSSDYGGHAKSGVIQVGAEKGMPQGLDDLLVTQIRRKARLSEIPGFSEPELFLFPKLKDGFHQTRFHPQRPPSFD